MAKYFNHSIYFPNDKNIYDALQSRPVTRPLLDSFLLKKGIILSPKDNKKEISEYISRMTFDYYDYLFLTEILEKPNQKNKFTNCSFSEPIQNEEIKIACQNFQKSDHTFDDVKIEQHGKKIILEVKDTEVDFSKTELNQKSKQAYRFEFEVNESSNLEARYYSNEKSQEILDKIIDLCADKKEVKIESQKISLQAFTSSVDRNNFFITLISSLEEHKFDDVTKIEINRNLTNNESDSDDDISELEAIEESIASYIKKASLSGIGILHSPEFSQLNDQGFFISKINWTAIDTSNSEGDKVEFEAQFGNPESCTQFQYNVKGIYRFNGENFSKSLKKLSPHDSSKKLAIIEDSARKAYQNLIDSNDEESSYDKEI